MRTPLFILLFLALAAYGQQTLTSVAVLPSDGTALNNEELEALTDEMRETALKVLPTNTFVLLKQDVVVKRLGGAENFIKECKESTCIVNLGKKAQVDYVSQATVSKLGNVIRLKVELFNVRTEGLVGMFTDEADNIRDLLAIVKKRAPAEVFSKIPGASGGSKAVSPSVVGGISGVQKTAAYEADDEKRYLVNLNTEPPGVALSFDGVPSCPKTPCKVELRGGSVRIIAALEQYETTDTTVSIKQNNQNITITLKPNFGILEIKPAYSDGIGKDKQWNLSINDKSYSFGEVRLSPNKYTVKLNHECYENIGFDVGINKGKREVFDMASNISLKKGGLALSAERNGEPVSEPVFVNGKQVGETPFSGAVPLCAKVEVGSDRQVVDVKLKHNEKVAYTHRFSANKSSGGNSFTDSRDGKKYRTVEIGTQTWMAENLNYNASGSRCYRDSTAYCEKYGRLYDFETAKKACPTGWHLPSKKEWSQLSIFADGRFYGTERASNFLKATSGWYKDGNGEDKYGFSALPGGEGNAMYGAVYFSGIGKQGNWWDADSEISLQRLDASWSSIKTIASGKRLLSVRCVKDLEQNSASPMDPVTPMVSIFKDSRDNKTYKTVKIGKQTWMAENLNYAAEGSKCYDNKSENCQKYGQLYNWNTAKTACPNGWHLPTKNEYGKLDNFVGGEKTAGKVLKSTSGWQFSGEYVNGTDVYGFSALPGGYCPAYCSNGDRLGYWWIDNANNPGWLVMDYRSTSVFYHNKVDSSYLSSVRCVKD